MRQVREGKTVTVSYRGEPVAEIRPLEKRKQTLEERESASWSCVECLSGRKDLGNLLRWGKPVPGALERFLAERD